MTRQATGAARRRIESSKLAQGIHTKCAAGCTVRKAIISLSHVGICLCVLVNLLFDI